MKTYKKYELQPSKEYNNKLIQIMHKQQKELRKHGMEFTIINPEIEKVILQWKNSTCQKLYYKLKEFIMTKFFFSKYEMSGIYNPICRIRNANCKNCPTPKYIKNNPCF